jgi:hypothetical protein
MDTSTLKRYAPKARRDFIAAVTRRAARFGLTDKGASPMREEGQLVFIEGQAYPKSVGIQHDKLAARIRQQGFGQVMEAAAYTWFNRLMAIRFMELHGYLDHSFRILSPAPHSEEAPGAGKTAVGLPEILTQAQNVDLPGLDRERVIELKLDGTRDEDLYRDLLLAQCRALNRAMPFLFEPVDDETELLLPDNLLQTDSPIRELVGAIPEEDWQEIEIVGWLYQFYISEKKDEVIGKVVKSEDIPAATQLFTPNWIVKYMVQNSLGAQWLATYPDSPLKGQMEYYIEPAEQTPEVQAQLAAITPSSLDPETLTLMDPACGSGHILVEAYDLFKAIYLERGYRLRDIPRLILEKNLFGLDIDERAAQLAGFALTMKARADDRRLFERRVKLNVLALEEMENDVLRVASQLGKGAVLASELDQLAALFRHAKTFGSLIQVPEELAAKLPSLTQLAEEPTFDLFAAEARTRLSGIVRQAELLAARYDAVVANPPYMGNGGMNDLVKKFAKRYYPDAKSDLFACFIERGFALSKTIGFNAMVAMESWMFLSSYDRFRESVLRQHTLRNLAHLPYDGKRPTAMGINFGVAVLASQNNSLKGYLTNYCCSRYYELDKDGVPLSFPTPNERLKTITASEFQKIPGSPVAYWASERVFHAFEVGRKVGASGSTRKGMATGLNAEFVRLWPEVSVKRIGFGKTRDEAKQSGLKWFPYANGGAYRKWYGNYEDIVNWEFDGARLQTEEHESGRIRAVNLNLDFIFQSGLSWTSITSASFSIRYLPRGFLFSSASNALFSTSRGSLEVYLDFGHFRPSRPVDPASVPSPAVK